MSLGSRPESPRTIVIEIPPLYSTSRAKYLYMFTSGSLRTSIPFSLDTTRKDGIEDVSGGPNAGINDDECGGSEYGGVTV